MLSTNEKYSIMEEHVAEELKVILMPLVNKYNLALFKLPDCGGLVALNQLYGTLLTNATREYLSKTVKFPCSVHVTRINGQWNFDISRSIEVTL